ncbi:hypothetical protein [uncultured Imperialibacter sp.]|uniref:hypothetical protein n=1 Tax=uncultured Imperialibacter sp. TaxID=1672639 RepID=UPI0030D9E2FA
MHAKLVILRTKDLTFFSYLAGRFVPLLLETAGNRARTDSCARVTWGCVYNMGRRISLPHRLIVKQYGPGFEGYCYLAHQVIVMLVYFIVCNCVGVVTVPVEGSY